MRKPFALLLYTAVVLLSGCSVSDLPFVYRPDLQQGTVLTAEDAEQVQRGMTRDQVRFLLGTPTLNDPFHEDRWSYVYQLVPGSGDSEPTLQRLTVYFDGNRVARVEGEGLSEDPPMPQREGGSDGMPGSPTAPVQQPGQPG